MSKLEETQSIIRALAELKESFLYSGSENTGNEKKSILKLSSAFKEVSCDKAVQEILNNEEIYPHIPFFQTVFQCYEKEEEKALARKFKNRAQFLASYLHKEVNGSKRTKVQNQQ